MPMPSSTDDWFHTLSDELISRLSSTVKDVVAELKVSSQGGDGLDLPLEPIANEMPASSKHSKETTATEEEGPGGTGSVEIVDLASHALRCSRNSASIDLPRSPTGRSSAHYHTWDARSSANSINTQSTRSRRKSLSNVKKDDAFSIDFKEKGEASLRLHATGDSVRVEEAIDLYKKFNELDVHSAGVVAPEILLTGRLNGFDADPALREAVTSINRVIGDNHVGPVDLVSLETFKVMMLAEIADLKIKIGRENAKRVLETREASVNHKLLTKIADTCRVRPSELLKREQHHEVAISFVERRLEPVVAVMVLVNSMAIGISVDHDPDWGGWNIVERIFAIFFFVEYLIKLRIFGVAEYYLGEDWSWNWFDSLLVLCALGDSALALYAAFADVDLVNLQSFTVVRLVRLVRITRLLRLLHLPMFKELTLMVHGIFEGLRTLFWAIVLLLTLVYALGVLTRQIVANGYGLRSHDCEQAVADGLLLANGEFKPGANCNRGAWALESFGDVLFDSVGRSMLTVFLCFTDSCQAPDGSPLLWHFWDAYGSWLVIGYVLVFIFITFGIFNLILAIFVENTLVSAQKSRQKRASKRYSDQVRQARKLNQLLVSICGTKSRDVSDTTFKQRKGLRKHLQRFSSRSQEGEQFESRHLNMRVNQEEFDEALENEEVKFLLEELDICITSRDQLFDVLDSDGNGYLAVNELVDGLMRLRGPADKGDTVASVLMIRTMQKHIRRFEEAVLHNQELMKDIMRQLPLTCI